MKSIKHLQIRIRTEIALGWNDIDLNALMPEWQGTQRHRFKIHVCWKDYRNIWSSQKRHVNATSQAIFTFFPRLVHSYRDEAVSRWDNLLKTTWHNHKQNLACRSCDSMGSYYLFTNRRYIPHSWRHVYVLKQDTITPRRYSQKILVLPIKRWLHTRLKSCLLRR